MEPLYQSKVLLLAATILVISLSSMAAERYAILNDDHDDGGVYYKAVPIDLDPEKFGESHLRSNLFHNTTRPSQTPITLRSGIPN